MAIATGQITIVDYSDALSLTGFISANRPKTQLFNPDTGVYNPNFETENMVLTASLFKAGSGTDIANSAKSIKWFENSTQVTGSTTNYTVNGKTLTIKKNVMISSSPAKDFTCEMVYTDPVTGLDLTFKTGISLSLVINGGGIVNAIAWTPDGNIFKNGQPASLTAECTLQRGTGVTDETDVIYKWWKYIGGTWTVVSGATTKTLTVTPGDVPGLMSFKCDITDKDENSHTYNKVFSDTVTFIDQSDPIQVMIDSTGGNIFKNGEGSTTLKARLFRSEEEIDIAGTKYTYKWYARDKDGAPSTFAGGASEKTGKSITVGDDDVNIKATFTVEIT